MTVVTVNAYLPSVCPTVTVIVRMPQLDQETATPPLDGTGKKSHAIQSKLGMDFSYDVSLYRNHSNSMLSDVSFKMSDFFLFNTSEIVIKFLP